MTEDLKASLRQCKTTGDVALIVSLLHHLCPLIAEQTSILHLITSLQTEPFTESAPKSLAARARAAGLEPVACAVFRLGKNVDFRTALADMTADEVRAGVLNLMAESICKDFDVLRTSEQLWVVLLTFRIVLKFFFLIFHFEK